MSTGTVVLFALMLVTALSPAIGGQQLRAIELGHTDTDGTSGLHVPSIGLLVAGDAVYGDVHLYGDPHVLRLGSAFLRLTSRRLVRC